MTNGWIDIKNTDMMLIMGGNPAENHPCGFKWPVEAKLHRNAKMIVVDPRFTRTAALRPISSYRFEPALISPFSAADQLRDSKQSHRQRLSHQLHQRRIHRKEGFKLPEDGLFSGFDGQDLRQKPGITKRAATSGQRHRTGGAWRKVTPRQLTKRVKQKSRESRQEFRT
jgi:hypothetical protein